MVLTERREKYDFSYIYETSHASFAVAKPGLEPHFDDYEWPPVKSSKHYIPQLIRASHDGNGSRDVSVGTVFQDMVGIFLGQGLPYWLSSSSSSRVVVTTWLIFAFIIATAYRSNLTAALTLPKYSSRPETLQEIVDTVDMVTLPAYGEQHRKFYSQSKSPLFQALGRLMKPGPSLMEGLKKALVEKSCHTEARKYLQYEILDKFTERDGSTRLYVSSGSIYPSPSAWPIPHDAPYKAHLNRWIITTLEAGLYEKWIADLLRETKLKSQRRQRQRLASEWSEEEAGMEKLSEGPPILTLSHTQGGFIILMLGLILATFAFIQELCSLKQSK
ncbi:Glutamate receptor 1 [Portunus trituberculatus]|uniref:Glutamate receptor 1 n=1 Tax=Portunus trituberculatus TaxID=210409 RepID=A0A5B7FDW5_PORTR|nr:Glutamate receptor 1 [Portunus trituberculatus]